MPTREQAMAAIDTIDTNGNNTAEEVRTVLQKILEYTETTPVPPQPTESVELFKYKSSGAIKDTTGENALNYSFKGIKEEFVSFTFNLSIIKGETNQYIFALPEEAIKSLLPIIGGVIEAKNSERITETSFVVPILYSIVDNKDSMLRSTIVKIYLNNKNQLVFDFMEELFLKKEDSIDTAKISTSICYHNEGFDLVVNKQKALKKPSPKRK